MVSRNVMQVFPLTVFKMSTYKKTPCDVSVVTDLFRLEDPFKSARL